MGAPRSCIAAAVAITMLAAAGCDTASTPGSTIELGWGDPFRPFQDGNVLQLTRGTQGAHMFPVAVRTSHFDNPAAKGDGLDAEGWIDVELVGAHDEPGDALEILIDDVRVDLRSQDEETAVFYFIPLILHDEDEISRVAGEATLTAALKAEAAGDPVATYAAQVVLEGGAS